MKESGTTPDNTRLSPSILSDTYYHLKLLRNCLQDVFERRLAEGSSQTVVDLGCGTMPYRSLVEVAGASYIPADLESNPNASAWIEEISARTNLGNDVADMVLSTQVLEHVVDPGGYLSECRRILRPGGSLVLSTHGYWVYHPDPCDLWRWTGEGLQRTMACAGFEVIEIHGLMGLGPAALQVFQDASTPHLPLFLRVPFTILMQAAMIGLDRFYSDESRALDAGTFLVVARNRQEAK